MTTSIFVSFLAFCSFLIVSFTIGILLFDNPTYISLFVVTMYFIIYHGIFKTKIDE